MPDGQQAQRGVSRGQGLNHGMAHQVVAMQAIAQRVPRAPQHGQLHQQTGQRALSCGRKYKKEQVPHHRPYERNDTGRHCAMP